MANLAFSDVWKHAVAEWLAAACMQKEGEGGTPALPGDETSGRYARVRGRGVRGHWTRPCLNLRDLAYGLSTVRANSR